MANITVMIVSMGTFLFPCFAEAAGSSESEKTAAFHNSFPIVDIDPGSEPIRASRCWNASSKWSPQLKAPVRDSERIDLTNLLRNYLSKPMQKTVMIAYDCEAASFAITNRVTSARENNNHVALPIHVLIKGVFNVRDLSAIRSAGIEVHVVDENSIKGVVDYEKLYSIFTMVSNLPFESEASRKAFTEYIGGLSKLDESWLNNL